MKKGKYGSSTSVVEHGDITDEGWLWYSGLPIRLSLSATDSVYGGVSDEGSSVDDAFGRGKLGKESHICDAWREVLAEGGTNSANTGTSAGHWREGFGCCRRLVFSISQ